MADTTLAVPSVATPSVQGNIDAAQVTNPSTSSTVLRENVVIADPNNFGGQATVSLAGSLSVDDSNNNLLIQMLHELRMLKFLIATMAGVDVPTTLEEDELI